MTSLQDSIITQGQTLKCFLALPTGFLSPPQADTKDNQDKEAIKASPLRGVVSMANITIIHNITAMKLALISHKIMGHKDILRVMLVHIADLEAIKAHTLSMLQPQGKAKDKEVIISKDMGKLAKGPNTMMAMELNTYLLIHQFHRTVLGMRLVINLTAERQF